MPSVMYVNNAVPVKTLREFVAYAKANPGKLSYSSPSVGTTPHLAVERLKQMTGIELVHVPYRGAPPAMQAVITGEVQLYLAGWGVGRGFVESGKVKALGSRIAESACRMYRMYLRRMKAACGASTPTIGGGWPHRRNTPLPVIDAVYGARHGCACRIRR